MDVNKDFLIFMTVWFRYQWLINNTSRKFKGSATELDQMILKRCRMNMGRCVAGSEGKWYIDTGESERTIRKSLLRQLERRLRELRNPPAFSRGESISVRNSCYPKRSE